LSDEGLRLVWPNEEKALVLVGEDSMVDEGKPTSSEILVQPLVEPSAKVTKVPPNPYIQNNASPCSNLEDVNFFLVDNKEYL